jgi:hypothetical protein
MYSSSVGQAVRASYASLEVHSCSSLVRLRVAAGRRSKSCCVSVTVECNGDNVASFPFMRSDCKDSLTPEQPWCELASVYMRYKQHV